MPSLNGKSWRKLWFTMETEKRDCLQSWYHKWSGKHPCKVANNSLSLENVRLKLARAPMFLGTDFAQMFGQIVSDEWKKEVWKKKFGCVKAYKKRALNSMTRTTTSMTFSFKFSRLFSKIDTPESFTALFFSPQKLARLFPLKEVKPPPDRKL